MSTTTGDQVVAAPATRRSPSSGIVALVLGILGLVALPLVGAVLALAFGYQARREALARPDLYNDDLGRAGRILGWVGLALAAAALFVFLLAVLFLMPL